MKQCNAFKIWNEKGEIFVMQHIIKYVERGYRQIISLIQSSFYISMYIHQIVLHGIDLFKYVEVFLLQIDLKLTL
jgi:hypothetical protein